MKVPINSDAESVEEVFRNSSLEKQTLFLDKLRLYTELLELASVESLDVMRDKRYLWNAFKRINVLPSSDLFEKITPGDSIEVYDANGIQIFSNFEFSALVSYNFEELIWYSFDELFGRDEKYSLALQGEFIRCFTTAKGPFKPNVDDHICWEKFSAGKKSAKVSMNMFAPIFGVDKKPKAMLASNGIQLFKNV